MYFTQCAKFHFWVTPDFSDKSGVTFNQKIGIGIGSENREWEKSHSRFWLPILTPDPENSGSGVGSGAVSGVTFSKSGVGLKIWKVNPDFSLPIPKIRDREPFREPFREWLFQNREWVSKFEKSIPISHSRSRKFGIGSRFGSRFGSGFQKIGIEMKFSPYNSNNSESRLGSEKSGVTWKKPLPNPLPIPIGSQNFAHCIC